MKKGWIVLTTALLAGSSVAGAPQDPAPGAASVVCVSVMPATMTGVAGNAAESGAAARDLLISFLSGPRLKTTTLDSRVRVQAVEEARQKDCGHMVTMALSLKRSGGGGGFGRVLGEAAGTAAWHIPGGSATASIARGVGVGAARAIGDIAAATRAKDELKLEWSLSPLASGRPTTKSDKLKAKSDGEDLLTPLVQRAAESIAEVLIK